MILKYKDKEPKIGKNVFIAPGAIIIGDVEIKDGASIWFNCVVRGDMAPVEIGENSNIQDNCTVHTAENAPVKIGNHVTVGHNAIVHACSIEDDVLIGMGAIILDNAVIKSGTVIAAGSIVKEKSVMGPDELYAGIPASKKKEFDASHRKELNDHATEYSRLAWEYIQESK
ncbi:MAG TPA: gamma carbonic anhydrase family protein [Petrotogaceae bacterium]|nr:gamma carbonic anhydrase family protein [Petrotogaceae bacterium]